MKKKLIHIFIIFGFIGLIFIPPSIVNSLLYNYSKIVDGNIISLDSSCYSLSKWWVVDSVDYKNEKQIFNLHYMEYKNHMHTSVMLNNSVMTLNLRKGILLETGVGGLKIYELDFLSEENSVRYGALLELEGLTVFSKDVNAIEFFASSLSSCD